LHNNSKVESRFARSRGEQVEFNPACSPPKKRCKPIKTLKSIHATKIVTAQKNKNNNINKKHAANFKQMEIEIRKVAAKKSLRGKPPNEF